MTALALEPRTARRAVSLASVRPADVAVGLLLAWWGTYFTWGSGGQDKRLLSVSLVLLGGAMVTVRPWERVPRWAVLLLGSVSVCAFAVAALAPTGWKGANEAASYLFATQVALLVLAWAQDAERQRALLGAVLAATVFEFAKGFVQWWSSGSADQVFVGTFFWHNQTGIFLVAGVALGLFALVSDVRQLSLTAWLAVPLCSAGVVFTTSRASQIALVAAFGAALVACALSPGRRVIGAVKVVVAGGVGLALTQLLAGPPFFAARVVVTAGEGSRNQDFTQNGVYRLDFWHQSVKVFTHWPLTGGGFHSFAAATKLVDPHRNVSSAFAHNGFLQALSDGGLLLSVPFFAVISAAVVFGARQAYRHVRRGELLLPGVFVTFLLLLLHSGMDFDWSYPSLLALAAVLGALSVGELPAPAAMSKRLSLTYLASTLALLALGVVTAWGGSILLNLPIAGVS